jgi:hypothetical protein
MIHSVGLKPFLQSSSTPTKPLKVTIAPAHNHAWRIEQRPCLVEINIVAPPMTEQLTRRVATMRRLPWRIVQFPFFLWSIHVIHPARRLAASICSGVKPGQKITVGLSGSPVGGLDSWWMQPNFGPVSTFLVLITQSVLFRRSLNQLGAIADTDTVELATPSRFSAPMLARIAGIHSIPSNCH